MLYPSGAIKSEVYLRADITKGCQPSNLYLIHARCLAALYRWIAVRFQRGWGLSGADEYRRLRPGSSPPPNTSAKGLNLRLNIANWTAVLRFTVPVNHSGRRSVGSTGRPASSTVRPTLSGGWLRPARRRYTPSSVMPASITASGISLLTSRLYVALSSLHWHSDIGNSLG